MPKCVVCVVQQPNYANDVMMAWSRVGVRSATLIDSRGMHRLKEAGLLRDDLPLIPSLEAIEEPRALRSATLFSIVPDTLDIAELIAATEEILGPLGDPETGILIVLPVLSVAGGQI